MKDELNIIKSSKGRDMLMINKFLYYFEKKKENIYYWSCSRSRQLGCYSRARTMLVKGKHVLKGTYKEHSHKSDAQNTERRLAIERKMSSQFRKLRYSSSSFDSVDPVLAQETEPVVIVPKLEPVIMQEMETVIVEEIETVLAQKMEEVRAEEMEPVIVQEMEPVIAQEMDPILVPDRCQTLNGELFRLDEITEDGNTVILLGTKSSLKLLRRAKLWYVDGTFNTVPHVMSKLFVVHGSLYEQTVPLLFGLMTNKSTACYDLFWKCVERTSQKYETSLLPKTVLCDFKLASIKSLRKNFPQNTEIKACYFHFSSSISKRIQKHNLTERYSQDSEFEDEVNCIKSLAFVPPKKVPNYFAAYRTECKFADELASFNESIYKYYIKPNCRYEPKFWNFSTSVDQQFLSTSNSVEEWHQRLSEVVERSHAGFSEYVDELGKELEMSMLSLQKARCEAIAKLMETRKSTPKLEYLYSMANLLD